jgi:hypothetical protein
LHKNSPQNDFTIVASKDYIENPINLEVHRNTRGGKSTKFKNHPSKNIRSGRLMSNKKGDILMEEIAESIISDIEQDDEYLESHHNNDSKSGRKGPLSLNR